ncbi:hypothetical protein BC351_00310 [Paenibacillus ferrarius]|uniref:Uncharacterized protein n=1 Tax=Paenibacillus ferrarius TaxID=1469647 RepID=A0A1V4HRZ5_9BACL|nr:hypothetical protein [Paenibacillus ferrarius]OPH61719.1 hypothetical protein BC351_00310 [Paenibacillus ferrarius]
MFTLENVDRIIQNIVVQLLPSQNLFKCLKYSSADALSQEDISDNEKIEMFDQSNKEKTKVFFTPLSPNVSDTAGSELRIYIRNIKPNNIYLTNVDISIQVICSNSVWRMDEGRQRPLVMLQEIISQLNGVDIGFIGQLFFERDIRIIPHNDYYTGYELIPSTRSI